MTALPMVGSNGMSDYKIVRNTAIALLEGFRDQGIEIKGIADDSRQVRPGDLFVAYPGDLADGRRYIGDAIQRGAVAVLWEPLSFQFPTEIAVPNHPQENLRAMVGWLAHAQAGWPTDQMPLLAVTGTNGKTTVSQWLARLYPSRCAVIGTLGAGFAGEEQSTGFTTPEAATLVRWIQDLRLRGAEACALEASSIGIEEGRMNGIHVDTAIFTNLTRDHLDYHGSMEHYAAVKTRLFMWPRLRFAVINLDDPMGPQLMQLTDAAKVIGYTLSSERVNFPAVIRAEKIEDTAIGQRFELNARQGRVRIETRLVGRYNLSNLLAVAAVLLDAGVSIEELRHRLSALLPPPGRMETFGGQQAPLVLVDYAHTPDALENALHALRPMAEVRHGQLKVAFGCGGDRDAGKRPVMGEIAARLADVVCLSSDNPRSENPLTIIDEIRHGAPHATVILDRAEAIATLIGEASPEDVILIAGKGHENYQETAGQRYDFQDATEVKRALAQWSLARNDLQECSA
jgi:UDP-N-acetylmuramyl-tripeptide synthetase